MTAAQATLLIIACGFVSFGSAILGVVAVAPWDSGRKPEC